jgi:hypothetical protein
MASKPGSDGRGAATRGHEDVGDSLDRMRRNPAGDWTIRDVAELCRQRGNLCAQPRGGGSHQKVAQPMMADTLTVPYRPASKPVYMRRLTAIVAAVRAL